MYVRYHSDEIDAFAKEHEIKLFTNNLVPAESEQDFKTIALYYKSLGWSLKEVRHFEVFTKTGLDLMKAFITAGYPAEKLNRWIDHTGFGFGYGLTEPWVEMNMPQCYTGKCNSNEPSIREVLKYIFSDEEFWMKYTQNEVILKYISTMSGIYSLDYSGGLTSKIKKFCKQKIFTSEEFKELEDRMPYDQRDKYFIDLMKKDYSKFYALIESWSEWQFEFYLKTGNSVESRTSQDFIQKITKLNILDDYGLILFYVKGAVSDRTLDSLSFLLTFFGLNNEISSKISDSLQHFNPYLDTSQIHGTNIPEIITFKPDCAKRYFEENTGFSLIQEITSLSEKDYDILSDNVEFFKACQDLDTPITEYIKHNLLHEYFSGWLNGGKDDFSSRKGVNYSIEESFEFATDQWLLLQNLFGSGIKFTEVCFNSELHRFLNPSIIGQVIRSEQFKGRKLTSKELIREWNAYSSSGTNPVKSVDLPGKINLF